MKTNVTLPAKVAPRPRKPRAVCIGNGVISKCNKSEKELKTWVLAGGVNGMFESVSTRKT